MMFAHNPLHGSGQAGFPHPVLALGEDAHAAQGIGMTDGRQRQPASDEAPHAIPEYAAVLAAPRQRTMPEPSHFESKKSQRRAVRQLASLHLFHIRMTFAFTTPRRFSRRTGEPS